MKDPERSSKYLCTLRTSRFRFRSVLKFCWIVLKLPLGSSIRWSQGRVRIQMSALGDAHASFYTRNLAGWRMRSKSFLVILYFARLIHIIMFCTFGSMSN